jgi:hypothetical protein
VLLEHYVTAVLYPAGLTRGVQLLLGMLLLMVNVLVYRRVLTRLRRGGAATARRAPPA